MHRSYTNAKVRTVLHRVVFGEVVQVAGLHGRKIVYLAAISAPYQSSSDEEGYPCEPNVHVFARHPGMVEQVAVVGRVQQS